MLTLECCSLRWLGTGPIGRLQIYTTPDKFENKENNVEKHSCRLNWCILYILQFRRAAPNDRCKPVLGGRQLTLHCARCAERFVLCVPVEQGFRRLSARRRVTSFILTNPSISLQSLSLSYFLLKTLIIILSLFYIPARYSASQ